MPRRVPTQPHDIEAPRIPNGFSPSNERTPFLGGNNHQVADAWGTATAFLRRNYCNYLLPIVPVALIVGALELNPVAIFMLNFVAIVPLASLLSDATEELAEHVGQTLGGLLNATFGNATELIVHLIVTIYNLETPLTSID